MKLIGIIKDAFLFPSKHTGRFAIYLLLSVLVAGFAIGGIITYGLGLFDSVNYLTGGMYLIISMIIACLISGYHVKVIKSGIELSDEVPVFKLYEDFMTGFNNILVLIGYFIIPAIIVIIVAFDTNLFDNLIYIVLEFVKQIFNVYIMGNSADLAVNAISHTVENFMGSLAITIAVASILFVIFTILESIGEARLANTGSVRQALNIFETMKDIRKIGLGRTILLILLILIVISIIEIILITLFQYYPFLLSIIYIIITPYMALVTRRSVGLLYSDIA